MMFGMFENKLSKASQLLSNSLRFCMNYLNENPQVMQMLIFSAIAQLANSELLYQTTDCGLIEGQFNGTNPADFNGYWVEKSGVNLCAATAKTGLFYNRTHQVVYSRLGYNHEAESVCSSDYGKSCP